MNVSMQNVDKVSALLTVNIEKADYQERVEKVLILRKNLTFKRKREGVL